MKSEPKKAVKKKAVKKKTPPSSEISRQSSKSPPSKSRRPLAPKASKKPNQPAPPASPEKAVTRPAAEPASNLQPPVPTPVPPLLLEGDASPLPALTPSGPGRRYSLGPIAPPSERFTSLGEQGDLPESYGTGRLFLAARDPRWLHAAWDLTFEEQRRCNALATDGHLTIRISIEESPNQPLSETDVHPDSRHWFVNVPHGNTRYIAELGYRGSDGLWHRVSRSAATATPPDTSAAEEPVLFATLPPHISFGEVLEAVRGLLPTSTTVTAATEIPPQPREDPVPPQDFAAPVDAQPSVPKPAVQGTPASPAAGETPGASRPPLTASPLAAMPPPSALAALVETPHTISAPDFRPGPMPPAAPSSVPLLEAARQLRPEVHPEAPQFPVAVTEVPAKSVAARTAALAEIVRIDRDRRVWIGSLEITELIRRQLAAGISSEEQARVADESSPGPNPWPSLPQPSPSSIPGRTPPERPGRDFWFNINAELVVYGATEPTARLTIGGRPVRLRPDGTFSFRFSLPDGDYDLPITAVSIDGHDGRSAHLRFRRSTDQTGMVGVHPQDAHLKAPAAAHVA